MHGIRSQKSEVRSASGVTLMEMLVVMAIASILLAIVFPAVGSGLGTLELRSAATRLAGAARYARDQAVYRQITFQLEIDSSQGTVSVADLMGNGARRYEIPDAIRVASVLPEDIEPGAAVQRFFFLPDGAAPAFEVVLTNERREIVVTGDPLTGTARVEER